MSVPGCSIAGMTSSRGTAMATRTVQAWQLRPGWIVIPEHGSPRWVASNRLEGAEPIAIVEFAGLDRPISYPATALLTIEDEQ